MMLVCESQNSDVCNTVMFVILWVDWRRTKETLNFLANMIRNVPTAVHRITMIGLASDMHMEVALQGSLLGK
jgi:hypothetical protein